MVSCFIRRSDQKLDTLRFVPYSVPSGAEAPKLLKPVLARGQTTSAPEGRLLAKGADEMTERHEPDHPIENACPGDHERVTTRHLGPDRPLMIAARAHQSMSFSARRVSTTEPGRSIFVPKLIAVNSSLCAARRRLSLPISSTNSCFCAVPSTTILISSRLP